MKITSDEMRVEYDFSDRKGIRGKYTKAYKAGHSVRIYDGNVLMSETHIEDSEPSLTREPATLNESDLTEKRRGEILQNSMRSKSESLRSSSNIDELKRLLDE